MFVLATLYAVAAVYVFDRFWPEKSTGNAGKVREQAPQGAPS